MKKLCYSIVFAVFAIVGISLVGNHVSAQAGGGQGPLTYGGSTRIWTLGQTLTNSYQASQKMSLDGYNGVSLFFTVGTTQALCNVSLKPQWGRYDQSGTNIVWSDESIISEAAASGSEIAQTPYSRVIVLSMDPTATVYRATYSERFNRLDSLFRVQMKTTNVNTMGKVEVIVNPLKN
jgi:hypothetical protein